MRLTRRQFGLIHQQRQFPRLTVHANKIAIAHFRQQAAIIRFRRDVNG